MEKIRNDKVSNFHLKDYTGKKCGYYIDWSTSREQSVLEVSGTVYYPVGIRRAARGQYFIDHLPTGGYIIELKNLSDSKRFVKELLERNFKELETVYFEELIACKELARFVKSWKRGIK